MITRRRALGMVPAVLLPGIVQANPHRLDDTGTHTVPPHVQMQWREGRPGTPGAGDMEAWLRVNVRVDMRRWLGRSGRVFLVLERDGAPAIEARWTTRGRLQPGQLVSGERALVWAGLVTSPLLEDQLQMNLRTGADWPADSRRLNFHFELDAD